MNNKRKIYLELFNLNESSSLDDIKKRYRELAKEFHPDRNKDSNAHERFLLIKEAYEYLINNQFRNSQSVYFDSINLEKERIEKIRIAKDRLKEYYRRKDLERKKYTISFYKSNLWKSYKIVSFVCLFYSITNLIDFYLPKNKVNTIVNEISENYNSLTEEKIILIKPNKGKDFFALYPIKTNLKYNDSIEIYVSKLLNKIHKVEIKNNQEEMSYITPNNNSFILLLITFMLTIPTIIFMKNEKKYEEIFLTKITLTIYSPIILYLIMNCFF